MRKLFIGICGLLGCLQSAAASEWEGATYTLPNTTLVSVGGVPDRPNGTAVNPSKAYVIIGTVVKMGRGEPVFHETSSAISLTEFASAAGLNALQTQVNSLEQTQNEFNQALGRISKQAWMGSALSAALVNAMPVNGLTNRLGFNGATVNGQSAISANYTYVHEQIDFNAGVAMNTNDTHYAIGRVGVGFSW